jgi:hypothetical protein
LLVWRRGWGRYDLYFLMVLVSVVRWMRSGGVDIWWRVFLISVCDDPWVVGRLRPCHPVSGGLRFWAVFCLVGAVFAVEETVESARRLRASPAPTASSTSAALGGYSWRRGASPAGCWLAMLCTCCWLRPSRPESGCGVGWTVEHLWAFSRTQPCAGGALRIWRIFQIVDITPEGSWAGP